MNKQALINIVNIEADDPKTVGYEVVLAVAVAKDKAYNELKKMEDADEKLRVGDIIKLEEGTALYVAPPNYATSPPYLLYADGSYYGTVDNIPVPYIKLNVTLEDLLYDIG